MKPKQRVLTAFAHQEPDRVPINYLANPGIDRQLKAHFGLAEDDHEGLRQALGVDFRGVRAPYVGPKLHPDVPGRSVDIWGIHRRWVEYGESGYWDYCDFPLKDATLEEIEAWPMPSPDDYDYSKIAVQCEAMKDYCIFAGGAGTGDIINSTGMIRTMEQVLVDLITDNPVCLRYIERKINIQLEVMRRTLEAARAETGDGSSTDTMIDLLWLGEDLGTQRGPLISLDLFRKHIRPYHQKFVDLARRYDIPVIIHSCGSSSWAFEDFIDMGIRVVDTLQPEAKDMAPAYLKARFGDHLSFHGCISTAGPVAKGTVQETIDDVRQKLDVMMPGGGYALSPTHQLQDTTPVENVVAMYETARAYGQY